MRYQECIKHGVLGGVMAIGLALVWGLMGLGVSGLVG